MTRRPVANWPWQHVVSDLGVCRHTYLFVSVSWKQQQERWPAPSSRRRGSRTHFQLARKQLARYIKHPPSPTRGPGNVTASPLRAVRLAADSDFPFEPWHAQLACRLFIYLSTHLHMLLLLVLHAVEVLEDLANA